MKPDHEIFYDNMGADESFTHYKTSPYIEYVASDELLLDGRFSVSDLERLIAAVKIDTEKE